MWLHQFCNHEIWMNSIVALNNYFEKAYKKVFHVRKHSFHKYLDPGAIYRNRKQTFVIQKQQIAIKWMTIYWHKVFSSFQLLYIFHTYPVTFTRILFSSQNCFISTYKI